MRKIKRASAMLFCGLAGLGSAAVAQTTPSGSTASDFTPVTDRALESPDAADWLMWRRTLNSWGYSPLNQITRSNTGKLRQVWTHPMESGIQEATPVVYKGVMYLPNPGNVIQAINGA